LRVTLEIEEELKNVQPCGRVYESFRQRLLIDELPSSTVALAMMIKRIMVMNRTLRADITGNQW
jgi:hypothetical protein